MPRLPLSLQLACALVLVSPPLAPLVAQVPAQVPGMPNVAGQPVPTPDQASKLLQARPDLAQQLRDRLARSGLTREQIHARLRAAGYPETFLDQYFVGADSLNQARPGNDILDAAQVLGLVGGEEIDSLRLLTDSARRVLDSLRADSLADTTRTLQVFGLKLFRRSTNLFLPTQAGPVDPSYRLGSGDGLVLILTGDVELAHELTVTREGFVAIPQVGQLYVANLTLNQLEDLLYARLGRVYSGVRRGGGSTRFSITVARLRSIQVFVTGDVARPGSVVISASGTALTALYAGGGPTERGSFRHVEIRRGGKLVDSLDLYDYLLHGDNSHDVRLENGDVLFVPVHATQVKVTGEVVRPAIYELKPGETLRDLLASAGGFSPSALRRRVQVDRILPPAQREPGGRDRVVLDLASDQFIDGLGPAFAMAPGDSVTVLAVASRRRDAVQVLGDVWTPGVIGLSPGMQVSDAIRLAGGPKPDVYLGQILITRLQSDSTRIQLRARFQDSTGAVAGDFPLLEDDEITVFSRFSFQPLRFITVTGAVGHPGRVPFREGMTLRDALLRADGLTEDALLTEAEIARLPGDSGRASGAVAETFRVALDSTYLFDRAPDGRYLGPPGVPASGGGAPEVALRPYDNLLILRQPNWELQRTVAILGQVRFPGRYALLTRTDRLVDLIQRAGGVTREAYPEGIKFFRSIDRGGRVGVDLPAALADPKGRDNLILSGGDSVVIPEYIPVVYVQGGVNSPMSVTYVQGKGLDHYVAAAGGYSRKADKNRAYVTQPNGKVQSVKTRFLLLPDSKPQPLAGGAVFVPERDPTDRRDWLTAATSLAQIIASLATTVLVVNTIK